MEDIFFTVAGCNHYFGTEAFKPRMKVTLYKEPDNKYKYDKEAIRVEARALGKIGYVANSPYTVLGESRSAGRLYDSIDDGATGRVLYVLPQGLVCELEETGFEKVQKIYKKTQALLICREKSCLRQQCCFQAGFCFFKENIFQQIPNNRVTMLVLC